MSLATGSLVSLPLILVIILVYIYYLFDLLEIDILKIDILSQAVLNISGSSPTAQVGGSKHAGQCYPLHSVWWLCHFFIASPGSLIQARFSRLD